MGGRWRWKWRLIPFWVFFFREMFTFVKEFFLWCKKWPFFKVYLKMNSRGYKCLKHGKAKLRRRCHILSIHLKILFWDGLIFNQIDLYEIIEVFFRLVKSVESYMSSSDIMVTKRKKQERPVLGELRFGVKNKTI